jgi:tetratricopeptide (TPR) repeat protein
MTKIPVLLLLSALCIQTTIAQGSGVSEKEALQLAKEIEATVNNNDATVLNDLFDINALTGNIKKKCKEELPDEMFAGFKSSFNMKTFGMQVTALVKDGSYRLVRTYESNNKRHMLFRAFGNGGLNYHDYSLLKTSAGIKADDVYVYITGEDITTTLADLLDASLSSGDPSQMSDELRNLLKMREYQKNKDYNSIIELYESSDEKYQKNKSFFVIYMTACQKTDAEKYKAALEGYAASYPGAPNTYLLMIDLYVMNKEYDKGIEAINKLDSLVKGDTFLDFFRGNVYLALENTVEAKKCYDNIFKFYPTLSYVIKNVVILHMNDSENEIAKKALDSYKKAEGFNQEYVDDLYLMYPELKE